jgi:hypothetical protein
MWGRSESFWFVLRRELLRRTHMRSHPRLLAAVAVALIFYWSLSGWTGTAARFLIDGVGDTGGNAAARGNRG